MPKKKKIKLKQIAPIFVVIVIVGFLFGSLGSGVGVLVSCDQKQILGFRHTAQPLMSIVQPTICIVDINVSINNEGLCSGKFSVLTTEKYVFGCGKLKDNSNKIVNIKAEFFDPNGNRIGIDEKNLIYNLTK